MTDVGDVIATAAATMMPMGNASAAVVRASAIAAAAIESADEPSDWSRVELFVIAALQLVLVLVAYRLDKAPHPSLISESAWAMFFGVIVSAATGVLFASVVVDVGANIVSFWLTCSQFGAIIRFISPIVNVYGLCMMHW